MSRKDWRRVEVESPLSNLLKTSPLSTPSVNSTSRETTSYNSNTNDMKMKIVSEKATVGDIILVLLLYVCKKVLLWRLRNRLLLYVVGGLVISIITDHFPPPQTILSISSSFIIRHAWTWTCGINAIFIYLTCSVYHSGNMWKVHCNMCRLLFLSMWTFLYHYIAKLIRWEWIRMSESTFVLVHCCLVCVYEMRSLHVWNKLQTVVFKQQTAFNTSQESYDFSKHLYNQHEKLVKLLVLLLSGTVLLLDLQLFTTFIYIDTMPQKMLSLLMAMLGCLLVYKLPSNIFKSTCVGNNIFVASF